jgi:hypothetical protein
MLDDTSKNVNIRIDISLNYAAKDICMALPPSE